MDVGKAKNKIYSIVLFLSFGWDLGRKMYADQADGKHLVQPVGMAAWKEDLESFSYTWQVLMGYSPIRWTAAFFARLIYIFFFTPLYYLYVNGPSMGGYGGYGGKPMYDICQQITKVDSKFWTSTPENMIECEYIVYREFHSYFFMMMTLAYLCLVFKAVRWLLNGVASATTNAYVATIGTMRDQREVCLSLTQSHM